jgi:hypothetical protein
LAVLRSLEQMFGYLGHGVHSKSNLVQFKNASPLG